MKKIYTLFSCLFCTILLFGQGLTPTALTIFPDGAATGVDPDAGTVGACAAGEIVDCVGNCVSAATAAAWIGDGFCDDGEFGLTLACAAFNYDSGTGDCADSDCAPAVTPAIAEWDGTPLTSDGCNPCNSTGIATVPTFTVIDGILNDITFSNAGQIACDYACGTLTVTYSYPAVGSLAECLGVAQDPAFTPAQQIDWLYPPTGTWGFTVDATGCGAATITPTDCPISFSTNDNTPPVPGSCVDSGAQGGCAAGETEIVLVPGTDGSYDFSDIVAVSAFSACFTGAGADSGAIPVAPCEPDCSSDGPNTNGCVPVELTFFKGTIAGNTNVLSWGTASEFDNSHFEVQHSIDGKNFSTIGKVEGTGTTVETQHYEYIDVNPALLGYYRLKQVDFAGTFAHSGIITLDRKGAGKGIVEVFPTPTAKDVTVQYEVVDNIDVTFTLTDVIGRIVSMQIIEANSGLNYHSIDMGNEAMGLYFITFSDGRTTQTRRIVKN